jgi:hypothetical protein
MATRIIALSARRALASSVQRAGLVLKNSLLSSVKSTSSSSSSSSSSFQIRAFSASAGVTDVKVPGMGDSITNGTIVSWQKRKLRTLQTFDK